MVVAKEAGALAESVGKSNRFVAQAHVKVSKKSIFVSEAAVSHLVIDAVLDHVRVRRENLL